MELPEDQAPSNAAIGSVIENQSLFRGIVEALPVFVWTALPDGTCDYVSPQWVEHTGIAAEQQLGAGWHSLVHPDDLGPLVALWQCTVENHDVLDCEFRIRGADAFYRWYKTRATPQRDASGRLIRWIGINVEIDRQKWQEEALRAKLQAEAKLQKIIETLPGVVFSLRQSANGELSLAYVSALFKEYYPGLSVQTLAEDALPFFAAMHPDDRPKIMEALQGSIRTLKSVEAQWRIQHPTKSEIWLEAFAVPSLESDGSILWQGFAHEITARKRSEQHLRVLQAAVDQSEIGVIWSDKERKIAFANEHACHLLGYTKAELLGKGIWEIACDTTREEQLRRWQHLQVEGKRTFEARHRRKDGSLYDAELTTSYVRFDDQEYIFNFFKDISERKAAQEALFASEQKFRSVVDNAGDMIALFDYEGRVLDVNQRLIDALGYGRQELLQLHCWEFLSARSKDVLLQDWHSLQLGQTITREGYNQCKDGTRFPAEARITRIEIAGCDCFLALSRDVTERKNAERALRESREFLRTLIDILPQRIFWKDRQGKFLGGNQAFMQDAGTTELMGKDDHDMPWRGAQADFFQMCDRRVMEFGVAEVDIIEPISQAGGRLGWLSTSKVPLRGADGEVCGLLGCYADITKFKESEAALRDSEARFRAYFENSGVGMCQMESQTGRFLGVNPSLCQMLGYAETELLGKSFLDVTHPDDYAQCLHYLRTITPALDTELRCEKRYVRKDGEAVWVDQMVKFFRPDGDESFRVIAIMQDISARKNAEMALRDSEAEFRGFFEISSVGMWQADTRTGKYLCVNQRFCEITGYSTSELLQMSVRDLVLPADRATVHATFERIARAELSDCRIVKRYRRKDGRVIWVSINTNLICSEEGAPLRVVGVTQNVTETKEAEIALEESRAKFRAVIDHAADMIMVFDAGARLIDYNQRLLDHLGYRAEALPGLRCWQLIGKSFEEDLLHDWQTLNPGETITRETAVQRSDGSGFPAEAHISRVEIGGNDCFVALLSDITVRKRTEEHLRLTQFAIDHCRTAIDWVDSEGRILYANDRYCEMLGLTREQLVDLRVWQVNTGFDPVSWAARWRQLREGKEMRTEAVHRHSDGSLVHTEVCANHISFNGKEYAFAFIADITERGNMLAALAESERRFRIFFDAASVGMTQANPGTGRIARVNPKFCEMVGYSADELYQLYFDDITHPEDRTRNYTDFVKVARPEGTGFRLEKRFIHKNGRIVWVDVTVNQIVSEDGQPELTIGVCQDITARREAEQELSVREEEMRAFFENSNIGMCQADALTGKLVQVNKRLAEFTGYDEAELVGKTGQDLTYPEDRPASAYSRWQLLQGHLTECRVEKRFLQKSGRIIWVDITTRLVRDVDGKPLRTVTTVQDITERKKSETALNRLAAIVEQSEDQIVGTDTNGVVTSWNRGAELILGRTKEEMLGRPLLAIYPRARINEEVAIFRRVRAGETLRQIETQRTHKDGRLVDISLTVAPIFDKDGMIVGTSRIARDITALKKVQRELLQHRDHLEELVAAQTADLRAAKDAAETANRAKTLFLANMSHELRTPMHAILSFAKRGEDVALRTNPEKLRGYFANIVTGGSRLLNLLNDLLDLSKLEAGGSRFDMRALDMREVIDAVVDEFAQLTVERAVEITVDQRAGSALAWGDSGTMHQVIRNVVANAVKFSPHGAQIAIALLDSDLPVGRRASDSARSAALVIEISDQGCGIPEAELEAVFDKFVQSSKTRSKAGGTGLGLAICREIMTAHCGTIEARNNPSAGATFIIKLPCQAPGFQGGAIGAAQGNARDL